MPKPSLVALVPMRHHSERVPGKNYRLLAGKPLYAYILGALLACPEISRVVVDTDSPIILQGVAEAYPSVVLIERPDHLRGDRVSMNEVLMHDVKTVPAKFYLQTHSTNPLLRPETISRAIETFFALYPERDSLFSVRRLQTRIWDADGRPLNHDPSLLIRTQDLPPLYEENSCLYIFKGQGMLSRKNRLGVKPYLFEMDPAESLDIDEEIDFTIAECLIGEAGARR